ncbi:hypothetical protein [PinkBerry-associated phage LS06-2018-MD08]|nr:hypothetical protein [PinkBerry-associated phage LS06-2018-MD08]
MWNGTNKKYSPTRCICCGALKQGFRTKRRKRIIPREIKKLNNGWYRDEFGNLFKNKKEAEDENS